MSLMPGWAVAALWIVSATGLVLELVGETGAINMCVGVGVVAIVATCMWVYERWIY